jgi:hypothetical protein
VPVPAAPDDVTREWLESYLRERAGTPAAAVRAVRTERIGDGFGLDGTVARVHLDGSGVPPSVVLKWLDAKKAAAETSALRWTATCIPGHVPTLLAWDLAGEDQALLVLEDVTPARQGDVFLGADEDDAGRLLDVEATFHAAAWDGRDVAAAGGRRWGSNVVDEAVRTRDALPAFLAAHGDAIPAAARGLAGRLPEAVAAARAALAGVPQTLIHADLHLDNVLFRPDGAPVVLDWPDACIGPVARDVAHLFVDGLLPAQRRAYGDALLRRYAQGLAARGVEGYGFDRLRADVRHALVVIYGGAVRWVGSPDRPETSLMRHPRVRALRDALVHNTAAALAEWDQQ